MKKSIARILLPLAVRDIIATSYAAPFQHSAFSSLINQQGIYRCCGINIRLSFQCRVGSGSTSTRHTKLHRLQLSSTTTSTLTMNPLADDDLVALPFHAYIASLSSSAPTATNSSDDACNNTKAMQLRLCVIRNQDYVFPLLQHEDDVETDLYLDPRYLEKEIRYSDVVNWFSVCSNANGVISGTKVLDQQYYYGVGWYGQRPVPSLGGGPGYGADATEVWSIDYDTLERLKEDGVEIPVIDVGIAHGEKARGGALF